MSDEKAQATAIKAAIAAEMPASAPVYEVDKVPGAIGSSDTGTPPANYTTIALSRRRNEVRRLSGDVMIDPGAVTTHYRGPTVDDVRELRRRTRTGLQGRVYDMPDGTTIGPFLFEFDEQPDYVEGGWSAFDMWTF